MGNTHFIKHAEQHNDPDAYSKEYIEFADLAVHDLDAPLRKLSVLIEMLITQVPDDIETQSCIERIKNCVGDMRSLIDDLSAWAMIDQVTLQTSPCDLQDVIQQALKVMPSTLRDRQAIITTLSLPTIEGDANQFARLFGILLENAIQYSKKNMTPSIAIHSSSLTSREKTELDLIEDKEYYRIVLTDNGIGFKHENAGKIFQPLVRLHGKSQFPGTGIGLAICKKIVDAHHGLIFAEGKENEGASFTLILPESS